MINSDNLKTIFLMPFLALAYVWLNLASVGFTVLALAHLYTLFTGRLINEAILVLIPGVFIVFFPTAILGNLYALAFGVSRNDFWNFLLQDRPKIFRAFAKGTVAYSIINVFIGLFLRPPTPEFESPSSFTFLSAGIMIFYLGSWVVAYAIVADLKKLIWKNDISPKSQDEPH